MMQANSFAKLLFLTVALLCPALCFFTLPAYSQDFLLLNNEKRDALDFKFIKNLIIVPLYLNGRGPYDFILDTGVGPMIITEPDLTDSLKIKHSRAIKITGFGKNIDVDALLTNEIKVNLGKAYCQATPTAILKKDLFNLSGYVGTPIYGLIGYSFFNSFNVRINYAEKRLLFYTENARIKKKGAKIPIEIINNKPYILSEVITTSNDTLLAKLIIDSGASHALSLESYQEKPFPLPKKVIDANLGVGLSGPISGYMGRINQLKLGDFVLKDLVASFPLYDEIIAKVYEENRNGNLGAEVLRRFTVTFDYQNSTIYLERNKSFKDPFEHNMAGIEIFVTQGPEKHFVISRIEPESPGEKAGILPNDLVFSVNFKDIGSYSMDDLNNLFKMGDGKRLILGIQRNETVYYKVLVLEKRI